MWTRKPIEKPWKCLVQTCQLIRLTVLLLLLLFLLPFFFLLFQGLVRTTNDWKPQTYLSRESNEEHIQNQNLHRQMRHEVFTPRFEASFHSGKRPVSNWKETGRRFWTEIPRSFFHNFSRTEFIKNAKNKNTKTGVDSFRSWFESNDSLVLGTSLPSLLALGCFGEASDGRMA